MSTIVQMPVRVKPPPATGATISPGCAARRSDHAVERRAHDGVVLGAPVDLDRGPGGGGLALGEGQILAGRVVGGLRRLQVVVAEPAAGVQFAAALDLRGLLGERRLGDPHAGGGRLGLRGSLVERRAGVGIVQRRHHLAGGDVLALLDHHPLDLAGDLGRDSRLAPRHHVAGGVQQRAALAPRRSRPTWRWRSRRSAGPGGRSGTRRRRRSRGSRAGRGRRSAASARRPGHADGAAPARRRGRSSADRQGLPDSCRVLDHSGRGFRRHAKRAPPTHARPSPQG